MLESRTSTPSGVSLLAVAGVLWGTGGLLGESVTRVSGMSPVAVAAFRLTLGGALLCLYMLLTGRRMPRRWPAWRRVLAVGACSAAYQCAYFSALATTSISVATLVAIGTAPVVVAAVEWIARLRRPTPRAVAHLVLALVGLGLLVGPGGPAGAGVLLAALAGVGFAVLTLLSARPVGGLDAPTTTAVGFMLGGAALLPVAALAGGLGFAPSPTAFGLLALFALAPTAVAYTAYFSGLGSAPAGVAAVLALLEPLTAAVLSAVLFGERLPVVGWVGAAVLACAVVATARSAG